MIDFNATKEEIAALKVYRNENYEAINQMLISNCETDIALLSADVENKVVNINYDRYSVINYLKTIKLIYRLMLKKYYSNKLNKKEIFYRGTNLPEVERVTSEVFIDRFLMSSNNLDCALKNALNWNRPACMNINLTSNIPYIYIKEFLNEKKYKEEILISPFTRIKKITEDKEKSVGRNSKIVKMYNVELQKQELDELNEDARNGLYDYILENSYLIKGKIQECIALEKENSINFENIRKLEQLLGKYDTEKENDEEIIDDSEENITNDFDDIARISKELEDLKETTTKLFEKRKQNIEFVNIWKRNIAVYIIAECREIEKEFENYEDTNNLNGENIVDLEQNSNIRDSENIENVTENDYLGNSSTENDYSENNNSENSNLENNNLDYNDFDNSNSANTLKEESKEKEEDKSSLTYRVKNESKENIDAIKKLLSDIERLISKQQNHAKIAGNIGISYSALNNGFEMRKNAEVVLELLNTIDSKINELCEKPKNKKNKEQLEKISKTNIEISTLINYLNNPKIAPRNTSATRFDEMAIIEENELKRGINEKITNLRGEAELKKLREDLEIIEDKGPISRFFGIFTGRNKLDDFMVEQIEIRQKAIRKTLSRKLGLAYNYSIHEIMAELTMFINENSDDDLVIDDVNNLKEIDKELRRNFIILDSKIQNIIEEKEGRNLPLDSRKLSKKEVIEVQTYRFLNKYGYDNISNPEKEEPKYQDTLANEISRIIEYINSSEIL